MRIQLSILSLVFLHIHLNVTLGQCIDTSKIDESQFGACDYNFAYYYAPLTYVCGCDGVTYQNAQCASAHGVTQWTDGPCDCFAPYFVDEEKNYMAFKVYNPSYPVCGCDNISYIDPNHARFNGITKWTQGYCNCIDSSVINKEKQSLCKTYIDTLEGFYNTYTIEGFHIPLLKGCNGKYYRNLCDAYYGDGVTKLYSYSNDDKSFCQPRNLDPTYPCSDEENIVCGCNGVQYKNPCIAEKHNGMKNYYYGNCRCTFPDIIGQLDLTCKNSISKHYEPVCACDSTTYYNSCEALNRYGVIEYSHGPCKCKDTKFINPEIFCENTINPICGCDDKVYKNLCEAVFKNGILSHRPCNCIEMGLIDNNIDCNEMFDYDPICGCDDRTYPNKCYASYKAGVTINKNVSGPCSSTCKDSILAFKNFPCSNAYEPVCGCDNITYDNECVARYHNGVIKWKNGPCISNIWSSSQDLKVQLYPNPTSDLVNINISGSNLTEQLKASITSLDGNINFEMPINKEINSFYVSELAAGIYFIKISKNDKMVYINKFIKVD